MGADELTNELSDSLRQGQFDRALLFRRRGGGKLAAGR